MTIERVVLEAGRATGIELTDGCFVRAGQFVASTLDVHQTFERLIGRDQIPAAYAAKLDRFQYSSWTLFGLHLALKETPRFYAEEFDPNIRRTLKWSIGAETMDDLTAAFEDTQKGKVPGIVQFGSGALSEIDPSQAPYGGATTYARHIMPEHPDISEFGNDHERFKEEFSERILDKWALYCPNMTRDNVLGHHVYTAREYTVELPNMRQGDFMMGAFNAEQVMYNHFGYRTHVPNLYLAGSSGHPGGGVSGGAGYITAGIIAKDLALKSWWKPMQAADLPGQVRQAAE